MPGNVRGELGRDIRLLGVEEYQEERAIGRSDTETVVDNVSLRRKETD